MKLRLSSDFYAKEAIDMAIEDFRHVCDCRVLDEAYEIELLPTEPSEELAGEFANYVLGLMKNRSMI
jgi:hypothetical protein